MSFVVIILITMLNTLTGCSTGTPMARVVGGLSLPFSNSQELPKNYKRFEDIYFELAADEPSRAIQLRHFSDAYTRVQREYVYAVNNDVIIESAIRGLQRVDGVPGTLPPEDVIEAALDSMLGSLDPHSGYMNPQEFRDSQAVTRGQFGGLGIEIKMTDGLIEVISPMVDTPAYRAGLKSGDLITHVNGDSIKQMNLRSAVQRLRGEPGSEVTITIRREGVRSFFVTITRAVINVKPIKWHIDGNIGIIRLTRFSLRSLDALEEATKRIRAQLGASLDGIILDLRNNPGGLLNQSVAIADAFLNQGKIVTVRDREGEVRRFDAQNGDIAHGLPMVVLINRGSASASEIVAGALQDHQRAILMGLRTFGKGSVQTIAPLDWDGAVRLTTALYYLPSGRTIQGAGVNPDFMVLEKQGKNGKREADLPNSLPNSSKSIRNETGYPLKVENCPTAGADNDDKLLGCAIMFLMSNSQESFISTLNARNKL